MKDVRFGQPVVRQPPDPVPACAIFLTASPERASPEVNDMDAEGGERATVGRHGEVIEVAFDDLPQPFSLDGNRLMHTLPQLLLDGLHLRPQAVAARLPFDQELAAPRLAADEGEAEEVEGLRLAEPTPLAVLRRKASKLDQPGLLRMQR